MKRIVLQSLLALTLFAVFGDAASASSLPSDEFDEFIEAVVDEESTGSSVDYPEEETSAPPEIDTDAFGQEAVSELFITSDISPAQISNTVLYPDTTDPEYMRLNSLNLQSIIDGVSQAGGGTVSLPEGTFYFSPLGDNTTFDDGTATSVSYSNSAFYVIYCRDNVRLKGAGQTVTVLCPFNIDSRPTNMFYHGIFIETRKMVYLENADFSDFTIDGSYTQNTGAYNSKGKGFYFTGFKNCSWYNITVKNTDGTGFGVDYPINAFFSGCSAINCGKAATTSDMGGSGFGIGVGYSTDESCEIIDCLAVNCKKFGFFFENQVRFGTDIGRYLKTDPLVLKDCKAEGNYYGFGTERCKNTYFYNCRDGNDNSIPSQLNLCYYFGDNSSENHIYENYKEVRTAYANRYYFRDINYDGWFVRNGWFFNCLQDGLINGYSVNNELTYYYGPEDNVTRAQAITILFRHFGQPDTDTDIPFNDINTGSFYYPAMKWAYANGIMIGSGNKVRPEDPITRQELATILYRCFGNQAIPSSEYTTKEDAGNVSGWAANAVGWCYDNGIMSGIGGTNRLMPQDNVTREQAGKMIYASTTL